MVAAIVAAPEPEPEPEPVVAAVDIEPIAEPVETTPEPTPVVEPVAAAAAVDVVEQPTWTILAPDPSPTNGTTNGSTVVIPPAADPQWPSTPEWPEARATSPGLPFLGRPAVPTGGVDALWAASDREVTTTPSDRPVAGVQACVSCGLSLSATARFCRRCGTSQR